MRTVLSTITILILTGTCVSGQNTAKKGSSPSGAKPRAVPITATPPAVVADCNAPVSFVALKTESTARFNVINYTTGVLKIARLKYEKRWVGQFELKPRDAIGVGVDYAEEIWRIEDSSGACLTVVHPIPGPMANIDVGQQ
jgi:hypothetical protein